MSVIESWLQKISYLIIFLFIILIIPLNLFPCFVASFLIYEIIISLTPWLEKLIGSHWARWVLVTIISICIVIIMIIAIISIGGFLITNIQNGFNITDETSKIILIIKKFVPEYFISFLPENKEEIKDTFFSLLGSNLIDIRKISHSFLHGIITIFIGLIVGVSISLNKPSNNNSFFITQLLKRICCLSQAFRNIVFAQIKVSLINTFLTAIMILIFCPIFRIYLPFSKTLIIETFIFGLLPIIGNLISNVIIVISAISVSYSIGIIMIIYLILIHKMEYFLHAKIIGNYIQSKSWEILLVMLILESVFGLEGLMAAPIYYSYLKIELKNLKII